MRVLVLEDDLIIALDLEGVLIAAGYDVLGPVNTQSEALALIESGHPDVALIDINLGSEKAFEVADRLAARHIPFAFLTGHSDEILPSAHRMRHVIAKPYNPDRLGEQVLRLARAK